MHLRNSRRRAKVHRTGRDKRDQLRKLKIEIGHCRKARETCKGKAIEEQVLFLQRVKDQH